MYNWYTMRNYYYYNNHHMFVPNENEMKYDKKLNIIVS